MRVATMSKDLSLAHCSISATKEGGVVKNLIAQALVERIVRAAKDGKRFKVRGSITHVLFLLLISRLAK